MDSVFPTCRPGLFKWRIAVCFLILLGGGASGKAQVKGEYVVRDYAGTATFEIEPAELLVSRREEVAGSVALEIREKVGDATVLEDFGGQALIKISSRPGATVAAREMLAASMPGTEARPVLYKKGVARNAHTRRYVSSDVEIALAPGEAVAQLAARVGAVGTRKTYADGFGILCFANGWQALEATERLKRAGVAANVMLQFVIEPHSVPNDPFFPNQWHLRNTGAGGGFFGIDTNAVGAWDISTGEGVTVVVVDDSLQTTHPDLTHNTPPADSGLHYDFRDGDNNPLPGLADRHGTAVAGLIAAEQNNSIGTSGVAPDARLLGVRLISGPVSAQDVADSLRWEPGNEVVSISNNSWGYSGAPALRDGGPAVSAALMQAARQGRHGLGQVTVFSNGNSRQEEDNGNYNGLANSRFVAAVSTITDLGEQAYYSTPGANVLVCAPSSGGDQSVWTTDVTGEGGYNPALGGPPNQDYTSSFSGTSAAVPLVSGGAALILSANPTLGWRDVHEILAQTARKIDLSDPDWATNGAGFHFNHKYGAGLIDLAAAVVRANDWIPLPPESSVTRELGGASLPIPIPDNGGVTRSFDFRTEENLRIERIEVVALITHAHRSELEIVLTAPSGQRSVLAERHSSASFASDANYESFFGLSGWTFTTTHHWGENSQGVWTLEVRDRVAGTSGEIQSVSIHMYGTPSPLERVRFVSQRQSVLENAGNAVVRIERIDGSSDTVSVHVASSNAAIAGAAIPGRHYGSVSQRVTFAPGELFKDIAIPIADAENDPGEDGQRFVYLTLTDPVGASLGGNSFMRLDILDDEYNAVTVVPGDRDASEQNGAPNSGTFIISRTKATDQTVVIRYQLSGTAIYGEDYEINSLKPMTATLAPGVERTTVTVVPKDDDQLEGTETVILELLDDPPEGGARYGVGVPRSAQLNITDTDDLPLVDIQAIDNSASENGATGAFRIMRRHPRTLQPLLLDRQFVVNLQIGGSAQPGRNYVPIEDRVVIPAGSAYIDLIVEPLDDAEYRPSQLVVVKLGPNPDYALGFTTEDTVNILENDPIPDRNKPTVTIVSPTTGARIGAELSSVLATGTATDNQSVARVTYQLNEGSIRTANGTLRWSAEILPDLLPGLNTLTVRAFDQFDNPSLPQTRTFVYAIPVQLTLSAGAGGKITPRHLLGPTQQLAGLSYNLIAKPDSKEFVFAGWTGDVVGLPRAFTFVMPGSDAVLHANFVANPFTPFVIGQFEGLIETDSFAFGSSGLIQMNLTRTGAFTAVLTMGGAKHRIKGEFTADQPDAGRARSRVSIPMKNASTTLELDLIVDLASEDGTVGMHGSVAASDASFIANITGGRRYFDKSAQPYPAAKFTWMMPGLTQPTASQPHGIGWATMSVDANGRIRWTGVLPDGTKAAQGALLMSDRTWAFFVTPYQAQGVMLGRVALNEEDPDSDLHGELSWFKPAINDPNALFPSELNVTEVAIVGSLYAAPSQGTRVLPAFDSPGEISFQEGYLHAGGDDREFTLPVTLSAKNALGFNAGDPHQVTAKIVLQSGMFRGSFAHPFTYALTGKLTPFSGVIFQRKHPHGAAQFVGQLSSSRTFQTGRVILSPPVSREETPNVENLFSRGGHEPHAMEDR